MHSSVYGRFVVLLTVESRASGGQYIARSVVVSSFTLDCTSGFCPLLSLSVVKRTLRGAVCQHYAMPTESSDTACEGKSALAVLREADSQEEHLDERYT